MKQQFNFLSKDELGDFNSKRDVDGYAAEYEFMPNQTIELEKSAAAKHLKLKLEFKLIDFSNFFFICLPVLTFVLQEFLLKS
jgi:hypothetical protein